MRGRRSFLAALFFVLVSSAASRAQNASRWETFLGISSRQKPAPPLLAPQGLEDHVVNGKLVLSLDDSIRLALSNNTDVRLDHSQIDFAQDSVHRAFSPFDPRATSSFAGSRTKTPTITQIQGAPVLNSLSQTTTFGYSQSFQTGTNFQASFAANKSSTNDILAFVNPSLSSNLQFTVTQPLLRNFGLFPNRAPILIAQRNLKQARANFTAQVNNIILGIIGDYWTVVLGRENLAVQQKSLDEAQRSYDHDKKALSLGALPPLDIYRSESQVASRRVGVIQAEYSLKQAADQFRRDIGADLDSMARALDLELTDQPAPQGDLPSMDIAAALSRALANRPEFETARQLLASDELNIRLAHNNLKPDLELSGFYAGNGVAGDQFNMAVPPQALKSGLSDSLSQVFHFTYPAYGATLSLSLPLKRHSAEANLADALVSRHQDQYQERRTNQSITQEVTNAVHSLEEAKLSMEAAKVAVDLSRESLHADERKYELGAEPVFFVLDAQTQLAQAELNLIQAQVNFQLAVAQLHHATGDLLDHHHVQIVEPSK
ncbi:MAG TPA: TolC family protein [Candidatus Acidoferrum sp.]|jgi:outer membrane protein TolC|nr:TolC family protein [Candidatus Acidoferrum sp.]